MFRQQSIFILIVAIELDFPSQFVVLEGSVEPLLFFGIIGTSVERIPFSLLPLTYRQFHNKTGRTVESVFSDVVIPPAASDSEQIKEINVMFNTCVC